MKKTKVLTLIVLTIVVSLFFVFAINIFGYRSNIANGITGTQIKKIEMGMTLEEVISILGKPYEINYSTRHHNLTCRNPKLEREIKINETTDIIRIVDSIYNDTNYCCDSYEETKIRFGKGVTLTYTKKYASLISYFIPYPMLWVHLDSNYCVNSVFAKRYPEDIRIYSLSWKLDEATQEEKQGAVDLFINDELFNKCFKK